jgi:hypothetical protein
MSGIRRLDITDQRFGDLVAKRIVGRSKYGMIWECQCDCGNMTTCEATRLRTKKKKSCGCHLSGVRHHMWSGYEGITGFFWANIKSGAVERGLTLDITIQDAWDLFQKQNGKCSLSGVLLYLPKNTREMLSHKYTASLDRINSAKGYISGNVQWVHKILNFMKLDMEQDNFIAWCIEVAKHHKTDGENHFVLCDERRVWSVREHQDNPAKFGINI